MATTAAPSKNKLRYTPDMVGLEKFLGDFVPMWLVLAEEIVDVVDTTSPEIRDFVKRQSSLMAFAQKVIDGRSDANVAATIGFGKKLDNDLQAYLQAWVDREAVESRMEETKKFVCNHSAELWESSSEEIAKAYALYDQKSRDEVGDLLDAVRSVAALERLLKSASTRVERDIAEKREREERARQERANAEARDRAAALLKRMSRD